MLLIRNVQIIDKHSPQHGQLADLRVRDGRIDHIAPAGSLQAEGGEVMEEQGLCISPAWVDMQVLPSEPGYEWKESLAQMAKAAVMGGFGTVLCYPTTQPLSDNIQTLIALQEKAAKLPIELCLTAALTHDAAGKDFADLYELHEAGAKFFTDGLNYCQSAGLMLRLREYISGFGGKLLLYPHDASLVADGVMNEGEASIRLGMKGIPEMAETLALARELALHAYAPVPTHFQPLTSPQALGQLRAAKINDSQLSCGLPSYYLLLTDEDLAEFDTNYKIFPPLRSREQVTQLRAFVLDGTIDVLSSGHQAQGLEEKETEFDAAENGMLALQTAFSVAVEALAAQNDLHKLALIVEKFTHNPRRLLDLPPLSIAEGQPATFTLFNPSQTFTLQKSDIPSTAKNSPFIGRELPVSVRGVWVAGQKL